MLLGWYFDIIVGYLIRTLMKFVRMRRSSDWPVEKGTVSSVTCPAASSGGPVAEIGYTYTHKGEYYSGVHTEGFLLSDSAKQYAEQFILGAQVPLRVDPARPETSILVG